MFALYICIQVTPTQQKKLSNMMESEHERTWTQTESKLLYVSFDTARMPANF